MATMKAAQVVERKKGGSYEIHTIRKPEPKGVEMLIKAGFCHTDKMVLEHDPWPTLREKVSLPLVGSHEPTGIVEALGEDVQDFEIGDRVAAICFTKACGTCADCQHDSRYCEVQKMIGLTDPGGAFAEYCLVDSRSAARIPDNLSFDQAAPLTCAGATIWSALLKTKLQKGQSVAICGMGALGHIGVQLAKALGLRVVGIDARQAPLDLVKRLGLAPDLALNATDGAEPIMRAIRDAFGTAGVDAAIDVTGAIEGPELALQIIKKHGLFVLVGQPPAPIQITSYDLIFRNLRIEGSLLANPAEFRELLQFVGEHQVLVDVRRYTFDQVNNLVEDAHQGKLSGKAIVNVS